MLQEEEDGKSQQTKVLSKKAKKQKEMEDLNALLASMGKLQVLMIGP